jgi:serine/threonine protein kinase
VTDLQDRRRRALADRYAIERELGAGGMATVYLAHELKHDRTVTVQSAREAAGALDDAHRQ